MSDLPFILFSLVAAVAAIMVVTRAVAVHALLYLVVVLLSLAGVFFALGAPFAAMLEVIIYAGAVMVLFVFVVMMLNLGRSDRDRERHWMAPAVWIGPALLSGLLLIALCTTLRTIPPTAASDTMAPIGPQSVGLLLYGPYVLSVELASFLLLAGLVSAFHIGRNIRGTGTGEP
ncbi:NADH-quinone oxidoreductase subunit J [Gluconacetobacter sp. 1b LMG 1731]|uniref:NADH-quinone oxidoreductase subunit J n=1 Tax=Gluconacetobacter dulcium TaxID=2729096 RepID=A0A7W4IJX4_9PROT|nr:NADH-quinone oxidoreductase subunit J [Gluconacetobacter dulcium]MBB2164119.1 NADH-quinone oxidoreductase subunit J [Gluconacetobacter dulcium]MBB2192823.1 NADH-quinone oxidoreductase subunit J [Gluconacetobacter dulcium]